MAEHKQLPDRWLNCPKIGGVISDSFVPFKTPLDERYRPYIERDDLRWEPLQVLGTCKAKKISLGLVIDLTNSKRYYKHEAFTSKKVEYHKIACRGHNESPSSEAVDDFLRTCKKFLDEHPDKKIGVHCTHGFNRTGFLIISYLVQIENYDLEAAVKVFQKAREPGIYKQDYLEDLAKYFKEEDFVVTAIPRPNWDDEAAAAATPSDDTERKKRSKEFMTGVPRVRLLENMGETKEIQRMAAEKCGFKGKGFPGSQPVSMDLDNVNNLAEEHHVVSWKADGTRYMLVIAGKNKVYFLDRDNDVFKADGVSFPRPDDLREDLVETVLDGEMVIDVVDGINVPRYLVYDVVWSEGNALREQPFAYRVRHINKIIEARRSAHQKGIVNIDNAPFRVRIKDFYDVSVAEKFYAPKFRAQVSHDVDGLIFQPSEKPYKADRCDYILKWKPPELNTIDFRLKIVTTSSEGQMPRKEGLLFVGGENNYFGKLLHLSKEHSKLNGKIVECGIRKLDQKGIGWVILRERTDKSFPNGKNTAAGVWKSITKPVHKEFLFDFIKTEAIKDPEWTTPKSERQVEPKEKRQRLYE